MMRKFFKWLFDSKIEEASNDLFSGAFVSLKTALISEAERNFALTKIKRDKCRKNDPKRAAYQTELNRHQARIMELRMDLAKEQGEPTHV